MGWLTLQDEVSEAVGRAFQAVWPESDGQSIRVAPTLDEGLGDYQCNAAMGLAKTLKQPPRAIAQAVVEALGRPPFAASVDLAGPGFINIRLDAAWLARRLEAMAADERGGVPRPGEGRTVILDYSSPNVAKPMHIGHIRSTVIGNALDRMLRALGYRVVADNHLGDWGTQFGLLILGFKHLVDEQALESAPVEELERIYRASYERQQADEDWKRQAREELVKLQRGDPENLALWRRFIELSRAEFDRMYARLGVSFDLTRGESFYNERLPAVVERLESLGLVEESEGALIVRLEEEKLPLSIVRKSDGAFNYTTTDIATVFERVEAFKPERIVYVTDERQQLHFRQFFAICRRMGCAVRLDHVWFGLMRLPEGTFSTREGNVIKLERLLDEAEERALAIVRDSSPNMPAPQQREVARAVGIGAVKYADLSQNPRSLVTFSWDKALAMDGNSAPYLQYAHARIASVLDKYRERFPGTDYRAFPIGLNEPSERRLGLALARYPEALVSAAENERPNYLADYLYGLAQDYSSLYQNVPFLKADEGVREGRVRLCELTARTLRSGLHALGIETPDRI